MATITTTAKPKWTREFQRQYYKQYYQLNKEKIKAYYLQNRPYFLEYKRDYNKRNREYLNQRIRINYYRKKWFNSEQTSELRKDFTLNEKYKN